MKLLLVITLLASLFGLTSSIGIKPRIIGGQDAERDDYPFVVYLTNSQGNLVCTGSLISPSIVLTSAHCQWGNLVTAQVGRYDTTDETESYEERKIVSAQSHPNWDEHRLTNDILLLKLEAPVVGVEIVKLATTEISLSEKQTLISIGYGIGADGRIHEKLQDVDLEYVPNDICQNFSGKMPGRDCDEVVEISYSEILTDDLMCTHFSDDNRRDFCHGDSGGPLLTRNSRQRIPLVPDSFAQRTSDLPSIKRQSRIFAAQVNDEYTQVGIASWGFECADPSSPGIGQRIGYAWDFIRTLVCRIDGPTGLSPEYFSCGSYLEFNAYPPAGSCDNNDDVVSAGITSCKGRSDCNTKVGECCVANDCICKVPNGIEQYMCVPDKN